MFGYFRLKSRYASPEIRYVYRNYYCSLCFALEQNYGQLSRLLLSYDVVILGILGNIRLRSRFASRPPCLFFNNKKKEYKDEDWKKIAAINVLLFDMKLSDDKNDDKRNIKSFLGRLLFKKPIELAKHDYPELYQVINAGYKEILRLEQVGANISDACDAFASLMIRLMQASFELSPSKKAVLALMSRWLYFIDQLDDYDSDVRKDKINLLTIPGFNKRAFVNQCHNTLFGYLSNILSGFSYIKNEMALNEPEDWILFSILNETMPSTTMSILMK